MSNTAEKETLHAIAKGDDQAFAAFYQSHSAKVYHTALSYTKDVEEAQEVTQDVFVKVYKYAGNFQGNSSVNTWVYRIVVNTSLNYLKKKKRFILFKDAKDSIHDVEFNHPGVLLENKEDAAALYSVIGTLPDQQKTAFILSYIEELPRQEVADIMETSLKAVESLLQRAKGKLRVELEKKYPNRRKSKK